MEMSATQLEKTLIAIGCGCLAVVGIDFAQAESFQHAASETLDRELMTPPMDVSGEKAASDAVANDGLIGRLEIPRFQVSVIVMEGDDNETLASAVGHVPGTALPWQAGNAVMAGHRDTFFRPVKDLREGDEIRITTARGVFAYRVTGTEIVEPDDVSVLAPTADRSLTLITCYPFGYIGPAPQRFIVHAR